MKPLVLGGLLAAILASGCTSLPTDVSQAVRRSVTEMNPTSAIAPARLASRVSVSPTGDDWVIDYAKTGDMGWCGTGGCTRELWIARGSGHVLAFSEQVLDWRLTPGQPTQLDIDIHGANCDASGSEPCLRRLVWNERSGRLEEGLNREGSGYLTGPLFQPVQPEAYPQAVVDEIGRREAVCQAAGGVVTAEGYPAVSSPDLNGDGKRDWIVGSRFILCRSQGDANATMPILGVTVITSAGEDWRAALTVGETAYVVELGLAGARFGLRDETLSLDQPGCPTRFFEWNAATQTLTDAGIVDWSPVLVPTSETWLECIVATARETSIRQSTGQATMSPAGNLAATLAENDRQRLEDYQNRYVQALPRLSAAEEAERRRVFNARYDDPEEMDAARWRGDLCVTLL